MALDLRLEFAGSLGFGFCGPLAAAFVRPRDGGFSLLSLVLIIFHLPGEIAVFTAAALRLNWAWVGTITDPLLLNATPRDCRLGSLTPRRAALTIFMTQVSVHFSPIAFPISYHV